MKKRTTRYADHLTVGLMAQLQKALVCQRMRQAREQAGLIQEEMADLLRVHKRTVENVENDRHVKGPYPYVNEWAAITGTTVEHLLHGRAVSGLDEPEAAALLAVLARIEERLDRALVELASLRDAVTSEPAGNEQR